jgi:type I restriction enzyme, R subunit
LTYYTEDSLVEQPAIALLSDLGWETTDCYEETFGAGGTLGRETSSEVVLLSRLRPALHRLNPALPEVAIELAVEELLRDRGLVSLAEANRQVYRLLKEGVRVPYRDQHGHELFETVRVIDWDAPENNDFFLASQFWVSGELYKKRPDLLGFVNGLPLVFIELKAVHRNIEDAYRKNFLDYKDTIPHLFWYSALAILSNGSQTRLGTISAEWGHFNEWKKINSEGEQGLVSLETALRGLCRPDRLLDVIENFTLFSETRGGLAKIVAKNHQYLGVNAAFESVTQLGDNRGKLGVFWHTQGSGKSYSMIFFAQKVLRKLPGNWTFVVITDRTDLDDQIYKNFAGAGAVTESEERVRASSSEHLKQLLQEDHRYVFTLIHKFRTEKGEVYPALSERSDVIVMTDEAHRTQYDVLALNMRNALPNAAFIGFTGTPLMAGEELTRQVFGDYVSVYNFKQSVDDNATVPLYYENRIPELQLTNPDLNKDMERLLEEAELDEAQESRLEREFSREYHLITRGDRLEKIAEDIVLHFMGRGFRGKAMVVSVDKATALRMYDKVRKHWRMQLAYLEAELETADPQDLPDLEAKVAYMRETDMAVVISPGQNEISEMKKLGLDILPHRRRMVDEDLDTKFKDPGDAFRIVFVCAMWMTGFDVPSCATIYLDKPMRDHTLMQTIARTNRVFKDKVNGLIVDYIGVFRNLQKALAIYGSSAEGGPGQGEMPVQDKQALVGDLSEAIEAARGFLSGLGVELESIHSAEGFLRAKLIEDAREAILVNDETKQEYFQLSGNVDRLFHAILPDPAANRYGMDRKAIIVIAESIRRLTPPADISQVMHKVSELLDDSISPRYVIHPEAAAVPEDGPTAPHWVDLSQIDFEALKKRFEQGRKRTQAEVLRGAINAKLQRMLRVNKSRLVYYQQFQKLIEEYNSGAKNVEAFFAELVELAQSLTAEEQRGVAEMLSEEELAVFDLLTRPGLKLKRAEKEQVKMLARQLLDTLKSERLVLDWRKRQQSRAAVQLTIADVLEQLPEAYTDELYEAKVKAVYEHVYDAYAGRSVAVYRVG